MVKATKKSSNTLIIVESPAKCKTIETYLGPGYKCVASFGHFRELASLNNIDIKHGFSLKYSIIEAKQKQVDLISKLVKTSEDVILATDDDREGEAIGSTRPTVHQALHHLSGGVSGRFKRGS